MPCNTTRSVGCMFITWEWLAVSNASGAGAWAALGVAAAIVACTRTQANAMKACLRRSDSMDRRLDIATIVC